MTLCPYHQSVHAIVLLSSTIGKSAADPKVDDGAWIGIIFFALIHIGIVLATWESWSLPTIRRFFD